MVVTIFFVLVVCKWHVSTTFARESHVIVVVSGHVCAVVVDDVLHPPPFMTFFHDLPIDTTLFTIARSAFWNQGSLVTIPFPPVVWSAGDFLIGAFGRCRCSR